jgi:hypothetical protein
VATGMRSMRATAPLRCRAADSTGDAVAGAFRFGMAT